MFTRSGADNRSSSGNKSTQHAGCTTSLGKAPPSLHRTTLTTDVPMNGFSVLIVQAGFNWSFRKEKHVIWSWWSWLWSTSWLICQTCVALSEDRQYTGHITRPGCLPIFEPKDHTTQSSRFPLESWLRRKRYLLLQFMWRADEQNPDNWRGPATTRSISTSSF